MNGTKFFTWGSNENGRFQCDFLSASNYEDPACQQAPGTYDNFYDVSAPLRQRTVVLLTCGVLCVGAYSPGARRTNMKGAIRSCKLDRYCAWHVERTPCSCGNGADVSGALPNAHISRAEELNSAMD